MAILNGFSVSKLFRKHLPMSMCAENSAKLQGPHCDQSNIHKLNRKGMVASSNDLLIKHASVSKTRAMETRMLPGRRPVMALTNAAGENNICV